MKILIVRMYPNELNIRNYNCQEIGLAKALVRKGNICDIVLYTNKDKSFEEQIIVDKNKKIHIYYLRGKEFLKNVFYEKELYEIIKKYDIVQTAEYDQIANVKLLRKTKGNMVIYHGPYESNFTKRYKYKCVLSDLYYMLHPKYKKTQVISKSPLSTKFLIKKGFKKIETVGVGIDLERFSKPIKTNEKITNLINYKKENKLEYLLYIGKVEERRNIIFLIDILKKILKERKNVRLIIIGEGTEDYKNKCKKYAKEQNVLDKILYYESFSQEELPEIYKESDVFLLPTQYEIFGMVLLEAIFFRIPVITTMNGGSSLLIKDSKVGKICDLKNTNEWSIEILKILKNKNENEMTKTIIEDGYTWDILAEKFIKIYLEILNKNKKEKY